VPVSACLQARLAGRLLSLGWRDKLRTRWVYGKPWASFMCASVQTGRNRQPIVPVMNKHQIKGRVKEAQGRIKQAAGRIVGDRRLKQKGKAQEAAGKVQAVYGDITRKLSEK
jgi:uncharacterized protein YjbJ (UPF0337 family)